MSAPATRANFHERMVPATATATATAPPAPSFRLQMQNAILFLVLFSAEFEKLWKINN